MVAVTADNPDKLLLVGDTDAQTEDRHLGFVDDYELPWMGSRTDIWDHEAFDESFDKEQLKADLFEDPSERILCKQSDPKKQGKFVPIHLSKATQKQFFEACLERNSEKLASYYYEMRNNDQNIHKVQLWMRKSGWKKDTYYCEILDEILDDKSKGKIWERDDQKCAWRNRKEWLVQNLDLPSFHRLNPVEFKCDRTAHNNFRTDNNKKCSEAITSWTGKLCAKGMPSMKDYNWEDLGSKNKKGQSVVNSCCQCSERRDRISNEIRAHIEKFAEAKKVCYKSVDFGNGKNSKQMWYFDNLYYVCKEFTFTGSLTESNTTKNRFFSKRQCNELCG